MKTRPRITNDEIARLEGIARELRAYNLASIYAAASGHPGGTLSIMDIVAVLYFHEIRQTPDTFCGPDRDRVYWSAGHKAPALYVALAKAGSMTMADAMCLRQLGSICQGHPNMLECCGVEMSSGSLGQGLGVSVGAALAARLDGATHRIYCLMGDGEQQEGAIWEAAMSAGHFALDNLCGIIDRNRLQIDGWTKDVMNVEPLADKYRSFGWHVIEIDGHDIGQIATAFDEAKTTKGKPTVIIADTVKGKGVPFMENQAGWHGVAPKKEQFETAIKELLPESLPAGELNKLLEQAKSRAHAVAEKTRAGIPAFSRDYWWNAQDAMKVDMDPTRMGFGRGLAKCGDDERIVTIHADISGSIRISAFEEKNPERKNRVFSIGIAEQNMMAVAAGLAKEGKIPITGTYGVFASGRAWDQIRTSICYADLNVKIAGAHGGISVGQDGATHQALEEISLMAILPNMNLIVPADSIETERATRTAILDIRGPVYLRFAREATPIVTTESTPFVFGKANLIRYRGAQDRFIDAFETVLASDYRSEGEGLAIIACGAMVPEAMRAAWILKEDFGLETRILNVHTVKPLDTEAIARAAAETGAVVTAEEHQVGGFGNIIAGAILKEVDRPVKFSQVGILDRFGESGQPWELMQKFGLTAEHIVEKAKTVVFAGKEG
ncbi:MAG: transketolase [Verrucomicrobia bacterium]|nr:transketolase [Verrucomicrobiota bacterium]